MKRIKAFLFSVVICFIFLISVGIYYRCKIENNYYDAFANVLSSDKFKNLSLQEEGIKRGKNLFMFGSSEFEVGSGYSTHAMNFFTRDKDGFQVNMIGKAGYQCLVHDADIGSLFRNLRGQKVVFVLSPQWFTKKGIGRHAFESSSSEIQIYGFLLNPYLKRSVKSEFAERILQVEKKNNSDDLKAVKRFCSAYSKNDIFHRGETLFIIPYYFMRYKLLCLKDEINGTKTLNKYKYKYENNNSRLKYEKINRMKFNWNSNLKSASHSASRESDNKFYMDKNYYDRRVKLWVNSFKNVDLKASYDSSPEYTDFKILLDVFKEEGIKPLIINVPVNGRWYDYMGFKRQDREMYYKKVSAMIKSYGFEEADFSNHEYEKYFLKDGSHLGMKGWVYVDEAIDRYYHEN